MPPPDHYAVLQVTLDAHPEVIKAAYRVLAAKFHPDTYPGPDAHARMVRINQAYQVLSVAERRRAYDMERSASGLAASGSSTRDSCPQCGLAVAWLEGRCRLCHPEIRQNGRDAGKWADLLAEWPLRVELPLNDCVRVLAHAMDRCGLSPTAVDAPSSDARLETAVDLSQGRDAAGRISAGFWASGSGTTLVKVSATASLPTELGQDGRPRQVFDWWLQHLARELELCLDHPPKAWRAGR
jgi:hypothetical protein